MIFLILFTLSPDRYYMAMYAMLAISVFVSALITNIAKRRWARSHPSILVKKVNCFIILVFGTYQ